MPVGHNGAKASKPWFVTGSPWPWFGPNGEQRKSTIGVGNPQGVLPAGSERFGFSVNVDVGLSTNASGQKPSVQPATENAVINAYASQFASAGAFRGSNYE